MPAAASRSTASNRPSASPANIEMPSSRQASRSTALPSSIDRQPDTWKPPIATANAGRTERPRNIERARILVRLHADQRHQAEIAVARGSARSSAGMFDAGVGLVDDVDLDLDVGTEHAPLRAIRGNAVDRGERIRRDHRPPPADHVAVVVVVRRLDQDRDGISAYRPVSGHRARRCRPRDVPTGTLAYRLRRRYG